MIGAEQVLLLLAEWPVKEAHYWEKSINIKQDQANNPPARAKSGKMATAI